MAKVKFNITSFKITTPVIKLQNDIKKAIIKKFETESPLRKKLDGPNSINIELAKFFYQKLVESNTFISMMHGDLRAEFGFTDSYLEQLDDICVAIAAVYLNYKVSTGKDFLTIIIGLHDKDDFDYEEYGVFTTEKGEKIYWLYWLLTQGTTPVVPGYKVLKKEGRGRSNMAIMINKDDGSYNYSVDSLHAGTVEDNWITRVLNANKQEFLGIIKKHFNGT